MTPLSGLRILVLDDDIESAKSFANAIAHLGGTASIATSIAEAKRLLVVHAPDCVVIDFLLMNGHGLGVISEFREHCPGLACVLTSGVDLPAAADLPVPFLPKPYEISQLAGAIHGAMAAVVA